MKKDLPVIKIVAEREVPYFEWDLEMEDDIFEKLVKWGKEDATKQDFVNIAIRNGLQELVDSQEDTDEDNDI